LLHQAAVVADMNPTNPSYATPLNRDLNLLGVRVLLVDDDDDVREAQRRILEQSQQISVIAEASTGEEALQLLESTKVDVVTLDLLLPGVSGIETIIQVKANSPTVRIIVLSAYGGDLMERSVQAGGDGYVLKSYAYKTLVERVLTIANSSPRSQLP
jgi:DNA-binding NarL/FixJ family response regulator